MASRRARRRDAIARALGASRVIPLGTRRLGGPLEWLALAHAVQSRLVSSGGRPTDPSWDTKRLVPFRRETWARLSEEAEAMSAEGRKVGPAQLAAMLIEKELALKAARLQAGS